MILHFISVTFAFGLFSSEGGLIFIKSCTSSYFEISLLLRIRLPNPMIYLARALVNTISDQVLIDKYWSKGNFEFLVISSQCFF